MRSSNPVLRDSAFQSSIEGARFGSAEQDQLARGLMTVQGTMAKTAMLLAAVVVAASFTWRKFMLAADGLPSGSSIMPWMLGGVIAGFALSLIIMWKPKLAPSLALPYALAEGLFLGAISAVYARSFSGENAVAGLGGGIVFQAVTLTFTVALSMFGLYAFRIIRVTERLRSIVFAATGGIALFYLLSFVLGFFGIHMPLIHSSGMAGIGFSMFVVGLAAFNLLLDFDLIERGARGGAPKYMEWYGAVALLITLVWLYIEILRLLGKLRSDD
ncbi:Bax inhibitor 1 like protein [Planctomycetes bacterium Poly30]|uniref:Bax inhibitor 1 like protein n=1 Tax=Saltatorellus ferox TaxID=2528018 RepID=A0A518EQA2_9BACT|nr:Bax inhibitor 1 like protein [Planctomycetes bacterium Poly30]